MDNNLEDIFGICILWVEWTLDPITKQFQYVDNLLSNAQEKNSIDVFNDELRDIGLPQKKIILIWKY